MVERFHIENHIDELSRLHCTQVRIHKISALPDNLIPSHRVENGAPHRVNALFVGFAALQLYFHDRHELRIKPFELLSGTNSILARSRMITASPSRALSCAARKETVLSTSMTAIICCKEISCMLRSLTVLASLLAMRPLLSPAGRAETHALAGSTAAHREAPGWENRLSTS